MKLKHPAKYNNKFLPYFKKILCNYNVILDPFAGTGKLKQLFPERDIICLEIEPGWATDIIGNALYLPFVNESFDAICTSPTYGNRMADTFTDKQPEKHYKRNTYTHTLGEKLHPDNSGTMQWGEKYKRFHVEAWRECLRVLKPNGVFCLNIKDHIRNNSLQHVTRWHINILTKECGLKLIKHYKIPVNGLKYGSNNQRVNYESIIHFKKVF
jgi:SAM-dependent methyltransferase